MKNTLSEMIQRNAKWYRDRPAFECENGSVTHGEFYAQSKSLANAMHTAGVRTQNRVSVLSMNSVKYCLVYGACELAGYITATINFRLAAPEILHILQDSSPRILFLESEFIDKISRIRDKLVDVEQFVIMDGDAPSWATSWNSFTNTGSEIAPISPEEDDICYLIFTSGTTGKPKGCMLEQKAETIMASTLATCMGVGSHDKTLLMMPLFHIGAKAIALAQQWVGGSVVLHRVFDPVETLHTIERKSITATHMAPTLIQALMEVANFDDYDTSSLRMLIYSAAAMPEPLLKRALGVFGPIFLQMYGQTEGIATMLPISAHQLSKDSDVKRRLSSVGHPFIGMEISIRDDNNGALPAGEIGEICIRGDMVMRGYWNNMPATLETLSGGWLHTGDVGRIDQDEHLHLVDRKKDVIISGGENIYSREVEDCISRHNAVYQTAVIAKPDKKWGESVCAIVSLRQGHKLSEEELVEHCRQEIARYKQPKSIIFVDALPLMPNGKINKLELRKEYSKA